MKENFKYKARSLREEHFPGRSIRSLDKELEPYFGKHFYAYISKVETGIIPSIESVKKMKDAYSLTSKEYEDLIKIYLEQKFEDEFIAETHRSGVSLEPEPLLFRKVKKKK